MSTLRMALAAGLIAATAACGSSSPSSPTVINPSPMPTSNTISIPMNARNLGTGAYVPNPLAVASGTTVTWVNNDTIAHTSTSDTRVFDSGTLGAGQSFSFMFQTRGTFTYHCAFHPGMVGTVTVQ